jgi:hypothetical protein
MLYKIDGEDLFLIATSEQTLAALHRDEILMKNSYLLNTVEFLLVSVGRQDPWEGYPGYFQSAPI